MITIGDQMSFDFLAYEEQKIEIEEPKGLKEYREKKKEAKSRFTAMQNLPYKVKVKRAKL